MHNPRKALKARSLRGQQMARARWAKDRARRDAEEPERVAEMAAAVARGEGPVEAGQFLGTLQWQGADGVVRRWVFRRGARSGQVTVDGVAGVRTVSWFIDRLRRHLASLVRVGRGE